MSTEKTSGGLRWKRWGLIVAAIGVAVALGAWVLVAVMFPPERLRALFTEHVAGRLDRDVRFEDARISLWPPVRVTVEQPQLAEPGGFSAGTAVRAQALYVDLEVLPLLARRIVVRRLELDRPALHLVLREDGTTNFDGLGAGGVAPSDNETDTPSSTAAMPVDFLMREFSVRGGQVLVDDLGNARRAAFDLETRTQFGLRGGRATTSGSSRIHGLAFGPLSAQSVADLSTAWASLDWNIEHRGAIDLETKRMAIERLALVLGGAEVSLQGVLGFGDNGIQLNLQARGAGVALDEVLGYLAAADAAALHGIEGSGGLTFDLTLGGGIGSGRRPVLGGTFAVTDGTIRYPDAAVGVTALSLSGRLGRDSLIVEDLRARINDQPITGHAALIGAENPDLRFALNGRFDLAAVAPLIAPQDTRLAGLAEVDLRGHGKAEDAAAMDLDGRVVLEGVRAVVPERPQAFEDISGQITFSKRRANVTRLTASAGQSSFTLEAAVTHPLALMATPGTEAPSDVRFTLRSPYLDLQELLPATPGSPFLPNARGSGRIDVGRLKNEKLDVRDVAADVQLEPGIVIADPFSAAAYGGTAHGNVRADFTDVTTPRVAFKARVDSARADSLLGTWTGAGRLVKGTLVTDLEIAAEGVSPEDIQRTISGEGDLFLLNGVLGPAPVLDEVARLTQMPSLRELRFRDVRTPFRVENGRVLTGPAQLEGNFGSAIVTGAVGFDGALDYLASLTIPRELVAQMGANAALAAGALADAQGNVLLDLRIGGNAKNPRVSLDEKAVADRLAGKAMDLIKRQGKGFEKKLFDALGIAPSENDSTAGDSAKAEDQSRRLQKELKRQAEGLLRGFFGKPDSTKK